MGSSQVTCASGTQFTYQIKPHCADLGKLKIGSSYRQMRLSIPMMEEGSGT